MERPVSNLINFDDPRQDVHKERMHDRNLHRYNVAERLLPALPRGAKVLELGGGIGEFSRRMKARGFAITFVDLSEHNVRKAQSLGLEAYQLDLNLGLQDFRDAHFHGIIMLEIIEHIVAIESLLQEANRVLMIGGFLLLSTPNFSFFVNRARIVFGKLSQDEGYHYRFFNVKSLKERLQNAGFLIEETANTMPAFGVNFVRNKVFGHPRVHVHVPNAISSLLAQTLIVRARKTLASHSV